MALTVMLILLCLVITYCCWGTCCKLIQKRRSRNRRTRSQASFDSSGSCASDPRFMMMWSPHHYANERMCSHHSEAVNSRSIPQRNNPFIVKPRILRSEIPPPPYEALFGQEISCAPPTYSSLALNQPICPALSLHTESNGSNGPEVSSNSFVTVVIEQDVDIQEAVAEERQFLRCQSLPTSIGSSSRAKHTPIPMRNGN